LIDRLRFLAFRLRLLSWHWLLVGALGVVAIAAAGVALAVMRGGGKKSSSDTTPAGTASQSTTNLFYLRGLAAKTRATGCSMKVRFVWKPDYHADQYIGATALITATGSGIAGTYRKPFTEKGVSLDLGPVSLAGGYQLWSAKVASLGGDPPGNDTTIQAAPPSSSKCR